MEQLRLHRISARIWRIGTFEFSARTLIRANFTVAITAAILLGAWLVVSSWPRGAASAAFVGRYAAGAGAFQIGISLVIGEIILWFWKFSSDSNDNASSAAAVGAFLLLPPLKLIISEAVNDLRVSSHLLMIVFSYLALSHLVYALYCWNAGRRTLLDL